MQDIEEKISKLRNRGVGQLLDDIGDQPPMLIRSIKRQFTRFAEDAIKEIRNARDRENGNQ